MRRWVISILLLCTLASTQAWARGGGGCLVKGTPITTPSGPVAIENLRPGDPVISISYGRTITGRVQSLAEITIDHYLEITVGNTKVMITSEHPVMVGQGEYRLAGQLKVGDRVYLMHNKQPTSFPVHSIRRIPALKTAYDLLVSPGGTFIAANLVVHNKGCFLPDTGILKSDGTETVISALRPGDELLAYTYEGRIVRTKVRRILRQQADEFILLMTDRQILKVTPEHPFYVGSGTVKTIDSLSTGDTIFAWDGQSLSEQRIISLEKIRRPITVFNLQTDHPHTFFAGHLAVHNKGGCFPPGTHIATPHGRRAIEHIAPGDEVLAVNDCGGIVPARVKKVFIARGTVMRIDTDHGRFAATEDHPVALRGGDYRKCRELSPGDHILKWKKNRLVTATVVKTEALTGEKLVFNLQVDEPHTFLAEGIVVHNKGGGCFPAGTKIHTPTGKIPIETLIPGDLVRAVTPEGHIINSRVNKLFATFSRVCSINTDRGTLRTTPDHPLGLSDGTFLNAEKLQPGQQVALWKTGTLTPATVLGVSISETEEKVYNLHVDEPHTFLADDFVVHNKGGSFSRSGSSRSRSGSSSTEDDPSAFLIIIVVCLVLTVVLILVVKAKKPSKSEELDYVYSPASIAPKAEKTEKLLEFLSRQDPSVSPQELRKVAESTFLKLQECWQKRDYGPMKPLLMEALFIQHTSQLRGMIRNHEINKIENLMIERIDLVNVRYTEKADQSEFTALITASARDYYVDDRTHTFLRGDTKPARFQEFWTFQRSGDKWVLREIEQAGESDILKDENFVEMLTDQTVQGIYEEKARREGDAGPWLEKDTVAKATRIDRMLNFLVKTDKIWNRTRMVERARQIFLAVFLAQESGDTSQVPEKDLFPEVAESLRTQILQRHMEGITVEYRNLCVRKVELILIRNFIDPAKDEFTVRISAHAQRIIRKGNQTLSTQSYVTPFEEYWTFGRLDGEWKLKEVLPPAQGKTLISEENVDEESSPGQLQWYYSQTRAT